ncbi:SRPBCC family protein [Gloeobacter violaceus]|uniref:Gll1436 protein n=1 Tax=Gloeobacter violaceus (strain ATCC 29082 / PCC 7421) TaxID=251221 RepID=Q7NKP1_GLOVI|nr:SRPBCC family protein [Gloeobacter violaceus]BAC89377.1 gll1436 [Gloeobacter violaceus PCC 7421]
MMMHDANSLKITTPSDREIAMVRVFNAPPRLVFDALTRPELLKRWLGPRDWQLVVCEIELQVGGTYRYVMRGPDGAEMGWGGVYREIVPCERVVATETFDVSWYPGNALVTSVLTEQNGRTTLTSTVLYETREARDAVLASPMESGLAESYDRLDELLTTMSAVQGHRDGA